MNTPIFNKIKKLMEEDTISFHTPGHKSRNTLVDWGKYIPGIDTTEIEGTDNLLEPRGIIKESQELVAKEFGAKATYFSVNGSTGSIHMALAGITNPGDKILIQRNCHKAVYNGAIINNLHLEYIYPNYNDKYKLLTGINPEDIDRALSKDKDIKVVVLTYPNYYGICSNLEEIAKIVHKHNRILMVDEAHGSHMGFSNRLPKSALELGADIVIQSTHKTLPSFTQTSMIHVGTDRVDLNKLSDRYALYTTTSPSYLFLASIEIAAAYMAGEGRDRLNKSIDQVYETIDRLEKIPRVSIFKEDKEDNTIWAKDPTKILLKLDGVRGTRLSRELIANHNIYLEMSDYYYGLVLTSLMNEDEDYERLILALEDLSSKLPHEELSSLSIDLIKPEKSIPLYKAYYGKKTLMDLKDSIGKVSATSIIPYPPGIPLIVPGEIITKELYEQIIFFMENGIEITGLMGYNKEQLVVVK